MTLGEITFEKDFKTRFLPLTKKLSRIELRIQQVLYDALKYNRASTIYWNKIRRRLTALYREMNMIFSQWSRDQIPVVYRRSMRLIDARIKSMKSITEIGRRGFLEVLNTRASSQIVQNLYRSASEAFLDASVMGRKNMFTITRLTQQTLINESLIDITVAQGMEMGNLRRAANAMTGQLWGELYELAENQQFVQAGKMRYNPRKYAELVARTKFIEAHSQAALVTASNYDTDLVQISSHNTNCTGVCIDYEGMIFSISGKSKLFPPLYAIPPYHPRCLHLMFPTFISMMETQGTLESFSAFSKGEISRPPIPANFIPIAERNIA